jgi:hypothetical protein
MTGPRSSSSHTHTHTPPHMKEIEKMDDVMKKGGTDGWI